MWPSLSWCCGSGSDRCMSTVAAAEKEDEEEMKRTYNYAEGSMNKKMDEPENHILLYLDKNINATSLVCRVKATNPISFIKQLSNKSVL